VVILCSSATDVAQLFILLFRLVTGLFHPVRTVNVLLRLVIVGFALTGDSALFCIKCAGSLSGLRFGFYGRADAPLKNKGDF